MSIIKLDAADGWISSREHTLRDTLIEAAYARYHSIISLECLDSACHEYLPALTDLYLQYPQLRHCQAILSFCGKKYGC